MPSIMPPPRGHGRAAVADRSLGSLLLADGVHRTALSRGSAESDLHLFTRQSSRAVELRLPALLRQLQARDIDVDWPTLLNDLAWWDRRRSEVAARWLNQFYRTLYALEAADPDPSAMATSRSTPTNPESENR